MLTTTIKKYIYVSIIKRFHKDIRVGYSKTETVNSAKEIENNVVRQVLLNRTEIHGQIEIDIMADVPSTGTGLGSSSALTIGLLDATYCYIGKRKSAEELAAEACDIEINQLKKPIGKQDQYAAALGDMRYIKFEGNGKVVTEKVKLSEDIRNDLEASMISFYIPNPNREGDKILQHQNSRLATNTKVLEKMRSQAAEGRSYLENGDLEAFAKLLNDAWELKKSLSNKISNPQIDAYYKAGLKLGAVGENSAVRGDPDSLLSCAIPSTMTNLERNSKD